MTMLEFMNLFPEFRKSSWDAWRKVLARLVDRVRELWVIVGRGAGKSRIVGLLAAAYAVREYRLAPGENIYVGIFAPDRKQAAVTFKFVVGLLKSVPELAALIVAETRHSIELSNGVIVEVLTASTAAPRGRAYALVIIEEAAFLPQDQSANPDVELVRSVGPALARVPGSLLVVVGSPYAPKGIQREAWEKYHDQPDGDVVFVQASTLEMNPTFDKRAIERAYENDPSSAAAEYGGRFRSDVEGFVSREAVGGVVVPGRLELPFREGITYHGFLDFAGGAVGGDSAVAAVAHAEEREGRTIAVLDVVREVRPPFSPEEVCAEFARTLQRYRVTTATSDRWAGQFPVEAMSKHRITVDTSARSKSDIYLDMLPIVNSRGCELLDNPRLVEQLVGLERRTARGGRDSIDHGVGGRDDVCNAASGALVMSAIDVDRCTVRVVRLTGTAYGSFRTLPTEWPGDLADPVIREARGIGEFASREGEIRLTR
jgi:hypothetical protein